MRPIITFFIFLFPLFSNSQSLFFNTYGTAIAEERAFDMVILDDGSIITAGDRYETASFERTGYLLKVDADGNEEWNRQLTSNEELYGTTICQLPNGNVFVAGYDYDVPNNTYGIVVAEYNESNGLPVYQRTHEFTQDTEAKDVIPMPDNGAIVLSTFETPSNSTAMLVRFNATGDTVWTKQVNPFPGEESPREMVLLSDGIAITGSVHSGSTDNVFTVKTDLDGNILWQQEYPSSGIEFGESIAAIPSGGFYIAGTSNAIGSGGLDLLAMKVDALGELVWATDFGRNGSELGFDIATMPDGGAVLTGSAYKADTSGFRDLALIRIDANGDELWTRYFGNVRGETGHEVQVHNNHIVACGKADVNNSEDVIVLRADFNGYANVGINDIEKSIAYSIYPNPFAQEITVQLKEQLTEPLEIQITDMAGRVVLKSIVAQTTTFNLDGLTSGVYFVTLVAESTSSSTSRLIKR